MRSFRNVLFAGLGIAVAVWIMSMFIIDSRGAKEGLREHARVMGPGQGWERRGERTWPPSTPFLRGGTPDSVLREGVERIPGTDDQKAISMRVRARDGRTHAVVAGAFVRFFPSHRMLRALTIEERDQLRAIAHDRERILVRHGSLARTDAAGVATIAVKAPHVAVCRKGILYGEVRLDPREGQEDVWDVILYPDRQVRIEVIDVASNPIAGVPVVLTGQWQGPYGKRLAGLHLATGSTNSAGVIVIGHLQELLRKWARDGGKLIAAHASVAIAGKEIATKQIRLHSADNEVVALVVPEHGSVSIEIHGVMKNEDRVWVDVCLAEAEPGREGGFGPTARRVTARGRVVFPALPAGEAFHFVARWQGAEARTARAVVAMPHKQVSGRISFERVVQVLHGRLLGYPDAQPNRVAVEVLLKVGDEVERRRISLDEDGSYAVPIPGRFNGCLLEQVTFQVASENGKRAALSAVVRVQEAIKPGRKELGETFLGQSPIIVKGRCEGVDSETMRLTKVEVVCPDPDGAGVRATGLLASVDRDGKFEIRGHTVERSLGLRVTNPKCIDGQIENVSLGAIGLRIPLVLGGSARVNVLMNAGAPPASLRAVLQCIAAKDNVRAYPLGDIPGQELFGGGERRRFEWKKLVPGSYDMKVFCGGEPTAVVVVRGVAVRAGELCDDQRLLEIDLRRRVVLRRLSVKTDDGLQVRLPGVVILNDGGADPPYGHALTDGRCTIATAQASPIARVFVRGCEPTDVLLGEPHTAVTLMQQPSVKLVVAEWPAEWRVDQVLRIRMRLDAETNRSVFRPRAASSTIANVSEIIGSSETSVWIRSQELTANAVVRQSGRYGISAELEGPQGERRRIQMVPSTLVVSAGARGLVNTLRVSNGQ